jgi:hypothetical protein
MATQLKSAALAALLLAIAGCTEETVDGDTIKVKFQFWVPASIFAVGSLGAVAGYAFRKQAKPGWVVMVVIGSLAVLIVAPGMLLDEVVVTRDRFSLSTGFWFYQTQHEIEFANLRSMRVTRFESIWRGGQKYVRYTLHCKLSNGPEAEIAVSDLMEHGGLARIVNGARRLGIPVDDSQFDC